MRAAYFLPLMLGLCACSATPKPVATPKAEPKHALVAKHDTDAKVVTLPAAPAQDLVSLDSHQLSCTGQFAAVVRCVFQADRLQLAVRAINFCRLQPVPNYHPA